MIYDYYEAVKKDILNAISEHPRMEDETTDEYKERLHDELWVDDSVTGNASGSYTCNAFKAESYLSHNWNLLKEALREFDETMTICESTPESLDVTIRCYILAECINAVVE